MRNSFQLFRARVDEEMKRGVSEITETVICFALMREIL